MGNKQGKSTSSASELSYESAENETHGTLQPHEFGEEPQTSNLGDISEINWDVTDFDFTTNFDSDGCPYSHELPDLYYFYYEKETRRKHLICEGHHEGCGFIKTLDDVDQFTDNITSTAITEDCWHRLKPGEHLKFYNLEGDYWHHALFEYYDTKTRKFLVTHYSNEADEAIRSLGRASSSKASPYKASVRTEWQQVSPKEAVYRENYARNDCFDPQTCLKRAYSRLGEKAYNVFFLNCEHFVRWAKQDRQMSSQVKDLVIQKRNRMFAMVGHKGARAIRELLKFALGKFLPTTCSRVLAESLSVFASVGIEITMIVVEVRKQYKRYGAGEITFDELRTFIVKRITESFAQCGACITGTIIGGVVTANPLGAIIGGILGSLIGAFGGMVLSAIVSATVNSLISRHRKESVCLTQ